MFEIRRARRSDAQAIWDVRNQAILAQCLSAYPRELIDQWTGNSTPPDDFPQNAEDKFFVALADSLIVGTGMIDLETGRIDAIFVRPSHMRMGVGKRMVLHLESLATRHGLQVVTLDASLNAASFYRAMGYAGEQTSIYKSSRGIEIPCIPMTKTLTP